MKLLLKSTKGNCNKEEKQEEDNLNYTKYIKNFWLNDFHK